MRRQFLLFLAVVVLVRLPFLNQAIQGDDIYYLAGAQHAQIDPLHPNHARYAFLGEMVDMRGHPHPPLNAWLLGALLASYGDIHEVPFHAAYILLSLIAAAGMWSLARRFTARPLLASLLFAATPAFVVNGASLEADLPFLAFWMASAALFVKGVDGRSRTVLAASGCAMALAALAAYQAVVLAPILAVYAWLAARRWRPGWVALASGPVALGAWQISERIATGAAPASVLGGYLSAYGFQALAAKMTSAAALTAHTGWLVFPVVAVAAFANIGRRWLAVVLAAAAASAVADPHPLFWASFGTGLMVLAFCLRGVWKERDPDGRFLRTWVLFFFAAAVALFFAGSARYLLPMAAPVCILAARALAGRPRWLAAGFGCGLAVSLSLAVVNYEHWDGYRQFARSLAAETASRRVWINGEWGLRYYFEAYGGLPVMRGQAVRPGEMVVSSSLAFPVQVTTGGGAPAPVAAREIISAIPLRLIGLGTRSAYSTSSMGLRPFDIATGPIDRVRADVILERKPARELLPMGAQDAAQHIVSGVYEMEGGGWRWMAGSAVFLLKRPPSPAPLHVSFNIPGPAPARRVSLSMDGAPVAAMTCAGPGTYTLVTAAPVAAARETVTVTVSADKTFTVPGDHRVLGIILTEVGFGAPAK